MIHAPTIDENSNFWLFPPETQTTITELETFEVDFPYTVPGPFASVDYETYYSKEYSLQTMTTWDYVMHKAFNAYCCVIFWVYKPGKARVFVGPPHLLPWHLIHGLPWVSHNAGFDELVHRRLMKEGIVPKTSVPLFWNCTGDLVTYLQRRRALQNAVFDCFGITISKEVRDKMKGGASGITRAEQVNYVYGDGWWCAALWAWGIPYWPADEQLLSRQTRHIGWQGIWVDDRQLITDISHLDRVIVEVTSKIPWAGGGRSPVSLEEMARWCAREGIVAPASLDLDDPNTENWQRNYGTTRPWLTYIKRITKANQTRTFLRSLLDRRRADGTVPFTLNYCKAPHTHRWQSGEGVRLQNLDKGECEGIKIRTRLRPRPQEKFIIYDLSTIEPRVLNWLAGDTEFLENCRKGQTPYEAHARAHMGYRKTEPMKIGDPPMYALAKVRVLQLGYQAGADTFVKSAKDMCKMQLHSTQFTAMIEIGGKQIWFTENDIDRAKRGIGDPNLAAGLVNGTATVFDPGEITVKKFRSSATKIRDYWYRCEREMRRDVGRDHVVTFANGKSMHYFDVSDGHHGLEAFIVKNSLIPDHHRNFYGGKLTENRVQFISRCVLGDILCRIELRLAKLKTNWHVHDEGVFRCLAADAEWLMPEVEKCFVEPLPWAPDLPLAAEGGIFDYYTK